MANTLAFNPLTGNFDVVFSPIAPTFTAPVTITGVVGSSALTITGATQTTSQPALNITQTWNNAGVKFGGGVKLRITSTASSGASSGTTSLMFDAITVDSGGSQVGAFQVTKQGALLIGGTGLGYDSGLGPGCYGPTGGSLHVGATNGVAYLGTLSNFGGTCRVDSGAVEIPSGNVFGWSSDTTSYATKDLVMGRAAAATLQLGSDVNGAAVSQQLQAANGITGTDRTGGNFTLNSGKGTGAGAESEVRIGTPTAVASGTTAQSITTRVTINSSGIKATGYLSSDGSAGVTAGPYTVITSITVKNGLITAISGS